MSETCRTLFDVKKVSYEAVDPANYMNPITLSGQNVIMAHANLTIDVKGEAVSISQQNSTKYVDPEQITVRKKGNFVIEHDVDSNIMALHSNLVNAGLGEVGTGIPGSVTVTAGKGSVATPFLTTSTTNVVAGMLIYIPNYGLRIVESVVANTSFVVDRSIDTAIATPTTFKSFKAIKLSLPKGTCDKSFNFIIETHDGKAIHFLGAVPTIAMELTPAGQLKMTITITAPEVSENSSVATSPTAETFAEPVIMNFTNSYFIKSDGSVVSLFPQLFTLGYSASIEENTYPGGRNNVRGYNLRASIKPKMSFDRTTAALNLVLAPRTEVGYSAYQDGFGVYFQSVTFFNVNNSEANGNHDSISAELNVNTKANKNVYIILP